MNYWQRFGIVLMFWYLIGVIQGIENDTWLPLVAGIIGMLLFLAPWKKGWQ
jgi:putative effector of murein hydrolase LrgA (UPF0299 family)